MASFSRQSCSDEPCWWNTRIPPPESILLSAAGLHWEKTWKFKLRATCCSVSLAKDGIAEGKPHNAQLMQLAWLCLLFWLRFWTQVLCRCAGHCCSIQALRGECFEHSTSVLWRCCMHRLPYVTFYLLWSHYELCITKSYMTLFVVGCLSELIS